MKTETIWLIVIAALIVFCSLLGIGVNLIGLIFPSVGAVFSGISDTMIEAVQLSLTAIGMIVARKA